MDYYVSKENESLKDWLSHGLRLEFIIPIFIRTYNSLYNSKTYVRSWRRNIPDPSSFKPNNDGIYWLYANENMHVIYHPEHPKFGKDVIELGTPYDPDDFMFIDFKQLCEVYLFLDECKKSDDIAWEHCPRLRPYRGIPEDRAVFGTPTALWDDPDYLWDDPDCQR